MTTEEIHFIIEQAQEFMSRQPHYSFTEAVLLVAKDMEFINDYKASHIILNLYVIIKNNG